MRQILHRTHVRLEPDSGDDTSWRDYAACIGMAERFFPYLGMSRDEIAKTIDICLNDCPVQQPCLEYALSMGNHEDRTGIWAGTTADERKKERRRRRRAA